MHTRTSAAATALLLTASAAGLALSSGSTAQASGSHPSHRAVSTLVVTIKSTADGPCCPTASSGPGNTIFRVGEPATAG